MVSSITLVIWNVWLRLIRYTLLLAKLLGMRNTLTTIISLNTGTKVISRQSPTINIHFCEPKCSNPNGWNTTKNTMAISELVSLTLNIRIFEYMIYLFGGGSV